MGGPWIVLSELAEGKNPFFVTFIIINPTARGQTSALLYLKGLSHEMDLAFDDMHGQFYAKIGYAASFEIFLGAPMIL